MDEQSFSILERIELGETNWVHGVWRGRGKLSVSSNGSNWVKLRFDAGRPLARLAFSILERIELGETCGVGGVECARNQLSVSSNGSNWVKRAEQRCRRCGENLSVSSNGSNWVKLGE